ncbi:MAG: DegT/DnrJ/EryC1/StrS aminotransferase family protein, partial [Zoogloea sp.]|nr:DegT/DnrJ/EryC1/StrS aminotransferase family protein [Zoogloea sp.]
LYRKLECDFGAARALPAGRAALGLMAVLRCWTGQGNSRRVALPASVCHDVVAAVLGAGCEPLFCDVSPTDGNVPEAEWARARGAGAAVAVVVHLYGNPVDVAMVRRHFPAPECLLIDDAAQALGSRNAAGRVGGQGDVGLISFGATKHIEVGGAALLFRDAEFADRVEDTLAAIPVVPEADRSAIYARFRQRFDAARQRLRNEGDKAATAFHGLLEGYPPSLQVAFPAGAAEAARVGLDAYPKALAERVHKASLWADALAGSGLVPVGMGPGCVPWRYTCRLPGLHWRSQHELGEAMRAQGLHVSHWYLPAHWLCGHAAGSLPESERLASEVFQFWIDGQTPPETIAHGAASVRAIVRRFIQTRPETNLEGTE